MAGSRFALPWVRPGCDIRPNRHSKCAEINDIRGNPLHTSHDPIVPPRFCHWGGEPATTGGPWQFMVYEDSGPRRGNPMALLSNRPTERWQISPYLRLNPGHLKARNLAINLRLPPIRCSWSADELHTPHLIRIITHLAASTRRAAHR